MTTSEVESMLESRGLSAYLGEDDQPRLRGPKEAITELVLAALKRVKGPLVKTLKRRRDAARKEAEAAAALAAEPVPCPPDDVPLRWDSSAVRMFDFLTSMNIVLVARYHPGAALKIPHPAERWRYCSDDVWRGLDSFPPPRPKGYHAGSL